MSLYDDSDMDRLVDQHFYREREKAKSTRRRQLLDQAAIAVFAQVSLALNADDAAKLAIERATRLVDALENN